MAGCPSSFQWTGTAVGEHDCTGVPLCPGSSFLAGFTHWTLVCHVQHPICDESAGLCFYFTERYTHIPSSENRFSSIAIGDVLVCVPWLPVQAQGLGGQCAMDSGGRL